MTIAIHIELDALCLLLLYAIAHQSRANVNQQMSRVLFRSLVYGVMIQLALDTLWLLVEGRMFPGAILANRVINALYLSAGVILGCIWYLYVLETLGYRITRRLQSIVMSPGFLFLGLNVLSIWTRWTFAVSEENVYSHSDLYWIQVVGAYGMLAAPLIHMIVLLFRHSGRARRGTVMNLLSFYAVSLVGSVVALFYTGMPGAWTCAAVSLVLIYMTDQDNEIVRDGLTGLNNRKTLPGVFAEYARQGDQLHLFMMDLDSFKTINDTFGHPAGDQALVAAAKILTRSMAGRRGIVVRYGGDEFLAMIIAPEAGDFEQEIQQRFEAYRLENRPPYKFAMSIGKARYEPGQTLEAFVAQADEALYQVKQRTKAGR